MDPEQLDLNFDEDEWDTFDDWDFDGESDREALASAGFGTDEDYGGYGDHNEMI
jgi:hypothetical protein